MNLAPYVDHLVSVVTNDGRNIKGVLRGFDQTTNIVLGDSSERIFSADAPMEVVELGLYVIRGDNVAIIGEINEDADLSVDYAALRALPIKPVAH